MDPDVQGPSHSSGYGCLPYLRAPPATSISPAKWSMVAPRLFVPGRDGPTSVEAVRAWSRPALGANAFQSSNEVPRPRSSARRSCGHGRATPASGGQVHPRATRRPTTASEAAPGPALGDGPRRSGDQQFAPRARATIGAPCRSGSRSSRGSGAGRTCRRRAGTLCYPIRQAQQDGPRAAPTVGTAWR